MMSRNSTKKKHLAVSLHNLPADLQQAVKQRYPLGFTDAMQRIEKPNGDFFYAVPFETDDIAYMVKIPVTIDDGTHEEEEKDLYEEEDMKGADELRDSDNREDSDEDDE